MPEVTPGRDQAIRLLGGPSLWVDTVCTWASTTTASGLIDLAPPLECRWEEQALLELGDFEVDGTGLSRQRPWSTPFAAARPGQGALVEVRPTMSAASTSIRSGT